MLFHIVPANLHTIENTDTLHNLMQRYIARIEVLSNLTAQGSIHAHPTVRWTSSIGQAPWLLVMRQDSFQIDHIEFERRMTLLSWHHVLFNKSVTLQREADKAAIDRNEVLRETLSKDSLVNLKRACSVAEYLHRMSSRWEPDYNLYYHGPEILEPFLRALRFMSEGHLQQVSVRNAARLKKEGAKNTKLIVKLLNRAAEVYGEAEAAILSLDISRWKKYI